MEKSSFSKSTAEVYMFKSQWDWAVFTLQACGILNIQSSHGSYGYFWSQPGCEFKLFLTEIHDDYLLDKLSRGKQERFDASATIDEIKRQIIEARKQLNISKDEARKIYYEIDTALDAGDSDSNSFVAMMYTESGLSKFYSDPTSIPLVTDYSYSLTNLVNKFWPLFIEQLKLEINNSKVDK